MRRTEPSAPGAAAGCRLGHLLDRLRPGITSTLARYRIPPADAEDLLQEVCLALLLKLEEIHSPEGWFMTVLRRRCARYQRERRRQVEVAVLEALASPGAAPQQAAWELRHDLAAALAEIPGPWRGVVVDSFFHGLEGDEVARRNGYAPASLRKVKSRALKALARRLGGTAGGSAGGSAGTRA